MFDRDEVTQLISDARITWDQRVHYAIAFLAGLRHGEVSALRWKHWEAAKPLDRLLVATSYSTEKRKTKGTKTDTVRHVPVHPVLASVLTDWKSRGWSEMMGSVPGPEDLILPLEPKHMARRRKELGVAHRDSDYSYKRWQADLATLKLRPRRGHDARATFVTLALDDGADASIIERLTHPPKSRSAFEMYNRGKQWDAACREVSKLNIQLNGLPLVQPLDGATPEFGAALGAVDGFLVEKMSASGGTRKQVNAGMGRIESGCSDEESGARFLDLTTAAPNHGATPLHGAIGVPDMPVLKAIGAVMLRKLVGYVLMEDLPRAKTLAEVLRDAYEMTGPG